MKNATRARRARERELHRDGILDAAERVFVREGSSATVAMIADEAQFAVGSLYNFFSGKDDIFGQVLLRISREAVVVFTDACRRASVIPEGGVGLLVGAWYDFHARHGSFLHLANVERYLCRRSPGGVPRDLEGERIANRKGCEALLLGYFTLLSRSPHSRQIDPGVMLEAFEGFVRMAHFHAMRDGPPGPASLDFLKARCTAALNSLFLK